MALRVTLVVPPFGGLDRPALGPHVLQACAHAATSARVSVRYAGMDFARAIGVDVYHDICYGPTTGLAGERVFAALAFPGVARLGTMQADDEAYFKRRNAEKKARISLDTLDEVARAAEAWLDGFVEDLLADDPDVVGCSTTFEQTCAALAILRRVKARAPSTITLLGGANCDGAMADGLARAAPFVDHVFSGECEAAFPAWLQTLDEPGGARRGAAEGPRGVVDDELAPRVIAGAPCDDMDRIPTPRFDEFYAQLARHLPDSSLHRALWLPYESSRGCWWGQKNHCTFCGINGQTMAFRAKSAARVAADLAALLAAHPTRNVCMVDNIMPLPYFDSLLPQLARDQPGLHMFYEQKANLTFRQVQALHDAGVAIIQPGIEALSTPLLRLMRKGVRASQNIALLRYCRAAGVSVNWNLLYAMPGDDAAWYADSAALMPLLTHLHPPTGAFHLSIDRFSPYFDRAAQFDIANVRPMPAYLDVFPADVDHAAIAYHFIGDYASGIQSAPAVLDTLRAAIDAWRARWTEATAPILQLSPLTADRYLLVDTRGLPDTQMFAILDADHARAALHGRASSAALAWALAARTTILLDDRPCPLATADLALYEQLAEPALAPAPTRKPRLQLATV